MNQQWFDKLFEELTSKQKEVLEKVLAGETDEVIARSLYIAQVTVRKHIQNICDHLKVKAVPGERFRRPELIALFRKYKPELVKINEENEIDDLVEETQQEETLATPSERINHDFANQEKTTNSMIQPNNMNDTVIFSSSRPTNDDSLFQLTVNESKMPVDSSHQNEKPIAIAQNAIEKRLAKEANCEDRTFFDINEEIDIITEYLQNKDDNFLISITGAGGFGKTSLTYKLAKERAASLGFVDMAWSTAKTVYLHQTNSPQARSQVDANSIIRDLIDQIGNIPPSTEDLLPSFKKELNKAPYLIVIDNLETLVDSQKLFDTFNEFHIIRPSKVIFTSRHQLKSHIFLREIKLSGISNNATLEMVRFYGERIDRVQQASDEDLLPIYEKTNGNPLLILLVINLLSAHDYPLKEVLEMLAQEEKVQEFLYRASLSEMSDNALSILMAMIEYSPGSRVFRQTLMEETELNYQEFTEAVTQCLEFNLLNSSKVNLNDEPRYSIHSLLYEFLRKQNHAE